jgi:hypothetical protein
VHRTEPTETTRNLGIASELTTLRNSSLSPAAYCHAASSASMPGWAVTLRVQSKSRSGFLFAAAACCCPLGFQITVGASPSGDVDGTVSPCRVGDPGA